MAATIQMIGFSADDRRRLRNWLADMSVRLDTTADVGSGPDRVASLVKAVRESDPDVVLLGLPDATRGARVTRDRLAALRALSSSAPDTPLIAAVTRESPGLIEDALDAGATDYVNVRASYARTLVPKRIAVLLKPGRDAAKPSLAVALPELHASNGRIGADAVARYLGIPLTVLAGAIGRDYKAVYKTPSASSIQPALTPYKQILDLLSRAFDGDPVLVRAWLRQPHPDLGNRTPLDTMLGGDADVVADMLVSASEGFPS